MTISATFIARPRYEHQCCNCRKRFKGPHVRLYGGCEGDPPYAVRQCAECCLERQSSKDEKERNAIAQLVEFQKDGES